MSTPATQALPTAEARRRRLVVGLGLAWAWGLPPARAQDSTLYRMVYAENFAPFSFVDNGQLQGLLPSLMHELLTRRLKLSVEHTVYPWARAQALVKAGQADGFVTVATPERLQYTVPASEWITQDRLTLFARADSPRLPELQKLRSIADLGELSIGSYMGHGWVQAKLGHLNVQYATDRSTALRMLLAKRFEVMADVAVPARAGIKSLGLESSIAELPITLDLGDIRLCIGKGSGLLEHMKAIDEALRKMKTDGTVARLMNAG